MWKCSDCGSICKTAVCTKCGLPREETLFDDIYTDDELEDFIEPIELPDPEQKKKDTLLKAKEELKREKRVEKLEKKLDKAKKTKSYAEREGVYTEVPAVKSRNIFRNVLAVVLVAVIAASAVLLIAMHNSKKSAVESVENVNNELRLRISALESELNNTKTDFDQANVQVDSKDSENNDLRSQKEALEAELKSLRDENSGLNTEIDNLNAEINDLNTKLNSAQSENSILRGLKDKVKVLEFNGTYHVYGCTAISSDRYWIYDRDQVVNNSNYKKCETCH